MATAAPPPPAPPGARTTQPGQTAAFVQMQFKAKCAIHPISATAYDAQRGQLLICDNKTFSLWQLLDSREGNGYITFLRNAPVPKGVKEVTRLLVDTEYGAYIGTGITARGGHVILLLDGGSGTDGQLAVRAGAPLQGHEIIETAIFNQRAHELVMSTTRNGRHGRLRFFSFRESVLVDVEGIDRFMLIQNRESAPGRASHDDSALTMRSATGRGGVRDTRVRALALDLRTNYLFGTFRRGLMAWDADTAEALFEIRNLGNRNVDTVAVLPGSDFVATSVCEADERWAVTVWQLSPAGQVLSSVAFYCLHAVKALEFADHGACLRGQLMLYVVDLDRNVRALAVTPPTCPPATAGSSSGGGDRRPVGGYLESVTIFKVQAELNDVVAFDMRDNSNTYLSTSKTLERFHLSSLLAVDDCVFGLSVHSPGANTTAAALAAGSTIRDFCLLSDARPLAEERGQGLMLALTAGPNALHLLDRHDGRLLRTQPLAYNGRAFQFPMDSASGSILAAPWVAAPTCLKSIPLSPYVAVGFEDGRVDIMDLNSSSGGSQGAGGSGGSRACVLKAPSSEPVTCLSWFPLEAAASSTATAYVRPLVITAGYQDGSVSLWLVHASGSFRLATLLAHPGSPVVMAKPRYPSPEAGLRFALITVAQEGGVKAWAPTDEQQLLEGRAVGLESWSLIGCVAVGGESRRSITCAELLSLHTVVLGLDDGWLETWELPTGDDEEEDDGFHYHHYCHPAAAVQASAMEGNDNDKAQQKGDGAASCAACGGGGGHHRHLAVPRSSLQRLAAHKARVTGLGVKSGSASTRLVVSASEDSSVLVCTFDGELLRVFQRCLLTRPVPRVGLDVDHLSVADPLRPAWRVMAAVGSFLSVLRTYERAVEPDLRSHTHNTDGGDPSLIVLARQALDFAPFISPVRASISTAVLCHFRYRRLKPSWLPTPEDQQAAPQQQQRAEDHARLSAKAADEKKKRPSVKAGEGRRRLTMDSYYSDGNNSSASPRRRRLQLGTPLHLPVVDVEVGSALPATGRPRTTSTRGGFVLWQPPGEEEEEAGTREADWGDGGPPASSSLAHYFVSSEERALLQHHADRPASSSKEADLDQQQQAAPGPWSLASSSQEAGAGPLPSALQLQQERERSRSRARGWEDMEEDEDDDDDDSTMDGGSEGGDHHHGKQQQQQQQQQQPGPPTHGGVAGGGSSSVGGSLSVRSGGGSSTRHLVGERDPSAAAAASSLASDQSLGSKGSLGVSIKHYLRSSVLLLSPQAHVPAFLANYYQQQQPQQPQPQHQQPLSDGLLQQAGGRPSVKAIWQILASYRKLRHAPRRPFTVDRAHALGGSRGVSLGFALGTYDRRLHDAIERRRRELEEDMAVARDRRQIPGGEETGGSGRSRQGLEMGVVGLKEEEGEEGMFWLDCLAEGYRPPEAALTLRSKTAASTTIMEYLATLRAKEATLRGATGGLFSLGGATGGLKQTQQQAEQDELRALYQRLKGSDRVLGFEALLRWERLQELLSSGHVNRSLVRSLLEGDGNQITFGDFARFVAALDVYLDRLYEPPAVTGRCGAVTFSSVTLWVSVNKSCSVSVALFPYNELPTKAKTKAAAALLEGIKGGAVPPGAFRSFGPIKCDRPDKAYEVPVIGLQEGGVYDVLFYGEHPLGRRGQPAGMNAEQLLGSKLTVEVGRRPAESLWLDWQQLSKQQQDVELLAVSKDRLVRSACEEKGVLLPTYDDFLMPAGSSLRVINSFRAWWCAPSNAAVREDFMSREVEYALAHEATLREAMARDGIVMEAGDIEVLHVKEDKIHSEQGKQKLARANRFRSWYRGGRVMEELAGPGGSLNERWAERLGWRTEFLSRRSARVEEAWGLAQELIDALRQELAMERPGSEGEAAASVVSESPSGGGSRPVHSRAGRAELLREAKAAKARELLQKLGLRVPECLSTLTAAQLANAFLLDVFDSARLAPNKDYVPRSSVSGGGGGSRYHGHHRGGPGDMPGLHLSAADSNAAIKGGQPPPPPPIPEDQVGYRELPAELGTLELRVALTLPEVMELAIRDGVDIPDIEDAASLLPSRRQCWHAFLDWYVSAEDNYETKWYDNPDRTRRDLSFVSAAREAVLKQEGDAARRDGMVRRMLDWQSPRNLPPETNALADPSSSSSNSSSSGGGAGDSKVGHESSGGSGSSASEGRDGFTGGSSSSGDSSGSLERHALVDVEFRKQYFNNYHVRKRFLQMQIRQMLLSRRAHATIPLAWSSFPGPALLFAALPTLLLQVPPERPRRVILFPSGDPELYSWEDVKAWYNEAELMIDDDEMREAERVQQVINFKNLTSEKERLERVSMGWEDRRSEMMAVAQGFLHVLDAEGLPRRGRRRFHHQPDLPPEHEEVEAAISRMAFSQGSGLENQDEIKDAEKELKRALEEEERRREELRKKKEDEARRKRDEETRKKDEEKRQERIQQQEEERRTVVAHLTELKAMRAQAAEEAQRKREEEELARQAREEEERLSAAKALHLRLQEERREQDRMALVEQQAVRADKTRQARELAQMRQEDFLSQQREREEQERVMLAADRLDQLRFIYTPYRTLFSDDELEALLWTGPHKYRPRRRRKWVDPYCLPASQHMLQEGTPDKAAYACLQREREFDRLIGTPQLRLSSRMGPRHQTPSSTTRQSADQEAMDVMLDMVRQVRTAHADADRSGACDEWAHVEAVEVTGGGLRRSLAEARRQEEQERERAALRSRSAASRPSSQQQQQQPRSKPPKISSGDDDELGPAAPATASGELASEARAVAAMLLKATGATPQQPRQASPTRQQRTRQQQDQAAQQQQRPAADGSRWRLFSEVSLPPPFFHRPMGVKGQRAKLEAREEDGEAGGGKGRQRQRGASRKSPTRAAKTA